MSVNGQPQPFTPISLAIFAPTADQRFLLGPDIFLRTHFPMTMRRFQNGHTVEVNETNLLDRLLHPAAESPGNRVYILYAAPGSGKSELMRWLQTQLERRQPERAAVTLRISRTELDVLRIAERFKQLLSSDTFSDLTHQRWQAVRRKPRTLSKLLVLSALENLLDSDDEINALYYRLLNAVQPYIERTLGAGGAEVDFDQVELISREAWESIKAETALSIPLEYEQFRRQMLTYFRHHLLEGLDLPDTLRRISTRVQQEYNLRPILLVDDLVQSLNLFATDLLDYFITLEEGQWDVVLGLTPAAFEANQRGRELLQRVAYLDTIDDRVEKLWLSDEAGHDSYVLTEANCHLFAAPYLVEYRRLNGISAPTELYPFNREGLVRLYRGLPPGKGKARYFLRHLRQVLEQIGQGESLLVALAPLARTEFVARCADPTLAAVCELCGPLLPGPEVRQIDLPAEMLAQFDLPPVETVIPVEPLLKFKLQREAITELIDDDEKAAVRDWLLGRPVNRQLLRPLRQGLARLLRRVAPPDLIHRTGIAQPHGLLHWRKPYLNTHPPICLEEVDAGEDGILVSREIGLLAFDLHRYSAATGTEAKLLESGLVGEAGLLPVFWAAADYQQRMILELEVQLGVSLENVALALYTWGLRHFNLPIDYRPPLSDTLLRWLAHAPACYLSLDATQQAVYRQEWQWFFDDFFRLRENLYDGARLHKLAQLETIETTWAQLQARSGKQIAPAYRWGKRTLNAALREWQTVMGQVVRLDPLVHLSPPTQGWVSRLQQLNGQPLSLTDLPLEVLAELAQHAPELYRRLRVGLIT